MLLKILPAWWRDKMVSWVVWCDIKKAYVCCTKPFTKPAHSSSYLQRVIFTFILLTGIMYNITLLCSMCKFVTHLKWNWYKTDHCFHHHHHHHHPLIFWNGWIILWQCLLQLAINSLVCVHPLSSLLCMCPLTWLPHWLFVWNVRFLYSTCFRLNAINYVKEHGNKIIGWYSHHPHLRN